MFSFRTITLVVASALVAVALAFGPKEEFEAYLKKNTPIVEKAFATENFAYFQKNSARDFTYTDLSGKTEKKAGAMAGLKTMFDSSSNIKVKIAYSGVAVRGNIATMKTTQKWSMTTKGPDGKPAKMSMTMTTEDTMKKVGGKWMMFKIVEKGVSDMKMNGKPMGGAPRPSPNAKPRG